MVYGLHRGERGHSTRSGRGDREWIGRHSALFFLQFHIDPECTKSKLLEWLNNNEPWCLSRQLLWGHRIPLYRRADDDERWVAAESTEEAARLLDAPPAAVLQCPDVLDTWFSSALIPLVVGGDWPRNTHPPAPLLDLLQTGHDILGFWIARMWTVCHGLTGEFPFTRVSLHGMIRDAQHRKMSKSLGNVVDPLHVINGVSLPEMLAVLRNSNLPVEEIGSFFSVDCFRLLAALDSAVKATKSAYPHGIKRYGTDALRFAFYKRDLSALDVSLNLIEAANEGHKFCNKLWNAVKYVQIAAEKRAEVCGEGGSLDRLEEVGSFLRRVSSRFLQADRRVLERLDACVRAFDRHMAAAHPHLAFGAVFDFLLRDFCDVYLVRSPSFLLLMPAAGGDEEGRVEREFRPAAHRRRRPLADRLRRAEGDECVHAAGLQLPPRRVPLLGERRPLPVRSALFALDCERRGSGRFHAEDG